MYLVQIPYYGQKSDLSIGHINFNSWLTDFSFGGGCQWIRAPAMMVGPEFKDIVRKVTQAVYDFVQ